MPPADPIAAIEFMMGQRGMTRANVEPIIGSSGRVSEVLNRRRALSVSMIPRLSEALQIPPGDPDPALRPSTGCLNRSEKEGRG